MFTLLTGLNRRSSLIDIGLNRVVRILRGSRTLSATYLCEEFTLLFAFALEERL